MDTKESLKILNRFVELGVRRSTLEKTIGLPMNCLASVLNGKKEFPKAWEAKVEKFISENTSPPIPEPMATILVKVDEWQKLKLQEQQFGKVEEYEQRIAQLEDEIKKIIEKNNKPENKKRILEERNTVADHSKHDKSLPEIDNSEIEKQIAAVKAAKMPDGMSKKVWEFDQNKKLKTLYSQLK